MRTLLSSRYFFYLCEFIFNKSFSIKFITIISILILPIINGLNYGYPSDYLQYIVSSLDSIPFIFFDRFSLLVYIRLIDLIIPANLLFPVGGILIWILIYLSSLKLIKKINPNYNYQIIFSLLFIITPFFLTNIQFIYPTIIQTLLLVLILNYLVDINKNKFSNNLILSILILFYIFSKIQSVLNLPFIVYFLYKQNFLTRKFIFTFLGVSVLASTVFILYYYDYIINDTLKNYFQTQYDGRSENNFPPFYAYLFEPFSLMLIISYILIKDERIKMIKYFGIWSFFNVIIIYIITQRGGPLIFNYNYESIFIGSILLSFLLGKKLNITLKELGVFFLSIVLIVYLLNLITLEHQIFFPSYYFYDVLLNKNSNSILYLLVEVCLLFLVCFSIFFSKKKYMYYLLIVSMSVNSSYKYFLDLSKRKHLSERYFEMIDLNLEGVICLEKNSQQKNQYDDYIKRGRFFWKYLLLTNQNKSENLIEDCSDIQINNFKKYVNESF